MKVLTSHSGNILKWGWFKRKFKLECNLKYSGNWLDFTSDGSQIVWLAKLRIIYIFKKNLEPKNEKGRQIYLVIQNNPMNLTTQANIEVNFSSVLILLFLVLIHIQWQCQPCSNSRLQNQKIYYLCCWDFQEKDVSTESC